MPSVQDIYPLSYPIMVRLAKDFKHNRSHGHTHDLHSSPSPSPMPQFDLSRHDAFLDHSLQILGSNMENLRGDIKELKRDVSDMQVGMCDLQNRAWNGMATRAFHQLKPVPSRDSTTGRLINPPKNIWPKSLGHLFKIKKSDKGLLRLFKLLQFYNFTGHDLWYSMSDSLDDLDSDMSSSEDEEEDPSKPTKTTKKQKPLLQEAVIAHPDKALNSLCLIIGVRYETVQSNEYYADFHALRNFILKRPAASEGSPAAAKRVRADDTETTPPFPIVKGKDTKRHKSSSPPKTPPVRKIERSPEFLKLLYEGMQPKPSPVSTNETVPSAVLLWGTPPDEVRRKKRELFDAALKPTAHTATPYQGKTQSLHSTPPRIILEESPEHHTPSTGEDTSSDEDNVENTVKKQDTVRNNPTSEPVVVEQPHLVPHQEVFSLDEPSSPETHLDKGAYSADVDLTQKSFESGTTEQDPELYFPPS